MGINLSPQAAKALKSAARATVPDIGVKGVKIQDQKTLKDQKARKLTVAKIEDPKARELAKRILGRDPEPVPIDTIKDAKVRRRLAVLCSEIREHNDEIAALETSKRGLTSELTNLGLSLNLGKVAGDGWLLLPPVGRSVLKKELLLENGVTMEQIELSTVEEPGKNYSVRKREEKG